MQKQVWTKKFLQHFQSEQPHGLATQRKLKELQSFGVCTPGDWSGLLMIPFEGQIGHGGRLDKALDLGAWGGSIQHILHAHPYHLLNHFFAATQILVGAINVNNIFVPTIYRCWSQR